MLVIYATTLENIDIFTYTLLCSKNELKVTYLNISGKHKSEGGTGEKGNTRIEI